MEPIKLNQFEVEALITFLKDYTNEKNLSAYTGAMPRYLFLAFIKLQKAKEQWEEAIRYTE